MDPWTCVRTHGPGPGPSLVSGKILQLIKTAGLVNGVWGWVMCAGATIYWDSYCQIIRRVRGGKGMIWPGQTVINRCLSEVRHVKVRSQCHNLLSIRIQSVVFAHQNVASFL